MDFNAFYGQNTKIYGVFMSFIVILAI